MLLVFALLTQVPEDENTYHLLDKQLAHYFSSWELMFDSTYGGIRTSQGCLDLKYWYIDLDTKFEVKFSKILGLRYRNKYLGDYSEYISDHKLEPFFQLKSNLRFLFTISTHFYKGEDELGLGLFLGKDYLNFLEGFIIAEDFDRNFSQQHMPEGWWKVNYDLFPIKLKIHINKYWKTGHFTFKCDVSNRYRLQSTEPDSIPNRFYLERGLHRDFYTRFYQDIGKVRLGGIFDLRQSEFSQLDTHMLFEQDILDIIAEPMIAYKINEKWIPHLYLSYNYKTENDSTFLFSSSADSLFDYKRDIYAYLVDVEFRPGGNFIWHGGMQRQFYYNNQDIEFKQRRLILGLEYRYKNVWFYLVEAMEGDFPTPKWMHNHTYLQLMLKF